MTLKRDTDYVLRLLVFYGKQGEVEEGYIYRREAIRGTGVPGEAQARLCRLLQDKGYLLIEKKERSAGYRLALPPEQISLKEVIELIENSTDLVRVFDYHAPTYSNAAWEKLQSSLDQNLSAVTIRDLMS